jgi:hypothetical protein
MTSNRCGKMPGHAVCAPTDTPARPRPARHAGRHRAPDPAGDGQPVTSAGADGRHRAAEPGRPAIPAADDALIIGIADAASYLGYDKPESFRRARTRTPVPGEGKMPDGRPCWTPPRCAAGNPNAKSPATAH